jgi:5-methylcytosine-specific restriction endonuclease McrA
MDHDERDREAIAFGRSLRAESSKITERAAANAREYRRILLGIGKKPRKRKGSKSAIRRCRRIRRFYLERQGNRCHYCGCPISDRDQTATLDHVVPISKGGEQFDHTNCVAACAPCNRAKADAILDVIPDPRTCDE